MKYLFLLLAFLCLVTATEAQVKIYSDQDYQSQAHIKNLPSPSTNGEPLRLIDFNSRTIATGTGLSGGGNLSADRTIRLADTAVTPGTYNLATITVDQQGRITAASNGSAGASLTVEEADGSPSLASVDKLRFDQADGFVVSNPSGTIARVDLSGVPYSVLNLTGSIVNADVSSSAAIAYAKLNLAGSILNADINSSAGIAYSKLNLSNSIVNADISTSAAIANSKLANSTISGVSLGSNLNTLTIGTGLSGTSYNGSAAVTIAVNTSQNIAKLTNLTSNGFVKTSGSDGTLSVDTNTYYKSGDSATFSDVTVTNGIIANNAGSNKARLQALSNFPGVWLGSNSPSFSNYNLLGSGADTILNADTGGTIYFRIANSTKASLDGSTGLSVSDGLAVTAGNLSASGSITSGATTTKAFIGATSGFPGIWFGNVTPSTTNYAFLFSATGNVMAVGTPATGSVIFRIGNSDYVTVTGTGTGIGTATTFTPSAQLEVRNGTGAANPVAILQGQSSQSGNLLELKNSSATLLSGFDSSGRFYAPTALTASTVGSAGGASALPATPTGYLLINVNGTQKKIPYFDN